MSHKFYKLPQYLTALKDLKPSDKIVYAVLLDYQGNHEYCWPGIRTIAKDTGQSHTTIIECIRRLEAKALLTVERRGNGKSAHYRVTQTAKESLPVRELNRSKNFTRTGKETCTEPVKKLEPNQTDLLNQTHIGGASEFSFVLKNGESWNLPLAKLQEYQSTYANVFIDIEQELRKAAQWLSDTPARRKTAQGMPRFLGGWLSRAEPKEQSEQAGYIYNLPTEEEVDAILRDLQDSSMII